MVPLASILTFGPKALPAAVLDLGRGNDTACSMKPDEAGGCSRLTLARKVSAQRLSQGGSGRTLALPFGENQII